MWRANRKRRIRAGIISLNGFLPCLLLTGFLIKIQYDTHKAVTISSASAASIALLSAS